jgi:hypothetical protein
MSEPGGPIYNISIDFWNERIATLNAATLNVG